MRKGVWKLTPPRLLRESVVAIALIAVALTCTGCPAMLIGSAGSAAYQGYKYEHKKNEPAAAASSTQSKKPSASASSSTQSSKSATAPKKIPDNEIE